MNFSKVSLSSLGGASLGDPLVVVSKVSDWMIGYFDELLSADELSRRRHLLCDNDKHRYSVAHGIKRHILAKYLAIPPSLLTFSKSEYGKPYCDQVKVPYFNLSHSADWVVISVSTQGEVGVDIEFPRSVNHCKLIRKVCSIEQQFIYDYTSDKLSTFLTLWVKKEAIAKACGRGLSVGLNSIGGNGELGKESVKFGSLSYSLYSCVHEKAFIAYASLVPEEPIFVRLQMKSNF